MENNLILNKEKNSVFKTMNILSLAPLIIAIIYTLLNFNHLPNMVPIHTSFDGTLDSFVSGRIGILLYSLAGFIGVVICVLFSKYPNKASIKIEITEKNKDYQYALASKFYTILGLEISLTFAFLQYKITSALLTGATSIGSSFLIFTPLIIISVLIYSTLSKNHK